MLTQEQIKNLKHGDPIVVKGIFSEVYADGDIVMQIVQKHKDKIEHDFRFFNPYSVSLPSEIVNRQSSIVNKYGPTRLFKKGDKVRVVEWNGRAPIYLRKYIGTMQVVECDEDNNGVAGIVGDIEAVSAPFLELVTPVEELELYSVQETMSHDGWQIVRDGLPLAIYDSRRHPNAKAAAEAERDRLNAEWRKEQNND